MRFATKAVHAGLEPDPTYRSVVPGSCYWERLSGLSGSFDDIITNENVDSGQQAFVEISPTDVAFKADDCGTWTPV